MRNKLLMALIALMLGLFAGCGSTTQKPSSVPAKPSSGLQPEQLAELNNGLARVNLQFGGAVDALSQATVDCLDDFTPGSSNGAAKCTHRVQGPVADIASARRSVLRMASKYHGVCGKYLRVGLVKIMDQTGTQEMKQLNDTLEQRSKTLSGKLSGSTLERSRRRIDAGSRDVLTQFSIYNSVMKRAPGMCAH